MFVGRPILAAAGFQPACCLRLAGMWGRRPRLQRGSGPAMWGRPVRLPNTTTSHQPPVGVPSGSRQPRRAMLAFALAVLLAPIAHAASIPSFSILSDDQGGWPLLLQSVGFMPQPAASARIFVLRAGSAGSPEWPARVETGAYLILEGES